MIATHFIQVARSLLQQVLLHVLFLCAALAGMAQRNEPPLGWAPFYLSVPGRMPTIQLHEAGRVQVHDDRTDSSTLGLVVARSWLNRPMPHRMQVRGGLSAWLQTFNKRFVPSEGNSNGPTLHLHILNLWLHEPGDAGIVQNANRPQPPAVWRLAAVCYVQSGDDVWPVALLDTALGIGQMASSALAADEPLPRLEGVSLRQLRRWPRYAGRWLADELAKLITDLDAKVPAAMKPRSLATSLPAFVRGWPPPAAGTDGVYYSAGQLLQQPDGHLAFRLESDGRYRMLYSSQHPAGPFSLDRRVAGCYYQQQLYWRIGGDSFEPMHWHAGQWYGMGHVAPVRRQPHGRRRFVARHELQPYRLDSFWKTLLD